MKFNVRIKVENESKIISTQNRKDLKLMSKVSLPKIEFLNSNLTNIS